MGCLCLYRDWSNSWSCRWSSRRSRISGQSVYGSGICPSVLGNRCDQSAAMVCRPWWDCNQWHRDCWLDSDSYLRDFLYQWIRNCREAPTRGHVGCIACRNSDRCIVMGMETTGCANQRDGASQCRVPNQCTHTGRTVVGHRPCTCTYSKHCIDRFGAFCQC